MGVFSNRHLLIRPALRFHLKGEEPASRPAAANAGSAASELIELDNRLRRDRIVHEQPHSPGLVVWPGPVMRVRRNNLHFTGKRTIANLEEIHQPSS